MKKLFVIVMMLASLSGFAQITVKKAPFNLKGLSYITPQSATVKGVQEVTLNFNEKKLPVSDLQAIEFLKKTNNSDFVVFQKNVLATVKILQDSVKSMTAQIAVLKSTKPGGLVSPVYDAAINLMQKSIASKADSSAIARLPELSFPDFNITGDGLHYTISAAPKRVTLAQRLAMKNQEPGLLVWQTDGNRIGEYRFSPEINDWVFKP